MDFYSYSPNTGMQYHATDKEARDTATESLRVNPIETVTWGEVRERGTDTGAGYVLKNALRLTYEAEHPQVINGRMENANGDLVLIQNIKEMDLLFHDMVLEIAVYWLYLSGKIERFKGYNFRDVTTVVTAMFEKHEVKRGGTEGNMTFRTFDGRYKLNIAIQKQLTFGPEWQAAQAKLLEALDEMLPEEAANARTIVNASFKQTDGQVSVSKILPLRHLKIENDKWKAGMEIVSDALMVAGKKKQIRLYERNEVGRYIAIPLDIAAF
ncbi:MAG: DUF3164 family protein [Geobacteraceae bacterium]|nr:DUF3164 family protein [Geobacteraceae bacterium]